MSTQALRATKIPRATHRPQQIWGGERELMLLSMLLAGGIAAASMNLVAAAICGALWLVCVYGLRRMAKADPLMSAVYRRQLRFRNYYAPFSRPTRLAKSARVY